MNAFVVYTYNRQDERLLRQSFHQTAMRTCAEEWDIRQVKSMADVRQAMQEGLQPLICCVDIETTKSISAAEELRAFLKDTQLLLLVSASMSPMMYIRPTIMPSGVLVRPVTLEQAQPLFSELIRMVQSSQSESALAGASFSVNSHGTSHRILLKDILYFESRNKKLFLCTKNVEIDFYDTLEHLMEQLPPDFIRCHKSFVINRHAVEQVSMAQNLIYLDGERVQIPISRSWKANVKEALK
ncbi:MAG: LytTR family transcriptional regulator [Ruminococcaceae bacterium]|nr:LytTR family transcriptional regulator [Oscillospiraceae bacterium]